MNANVKNKTHAHRRVCLQLIRAYVLREGNNKRKQKHNKNTKNNKKKKQAHAR